MVPGVDLVGPLPKQVQHVTRFGITVASTAHNRRLAQDFVSLFQIDRWACRNRKTRHATSLIVAFCNGPTYNRNRYMLRLWAPRTK
jgi:hypothetical protein